MSSNLLKTTLCTIIICSLWSCSNNGEKSGELKRMNVEKYFESPDFDNISQKVKVINIFKPEFTDSSMLESPQLLAIKDKKAYIHDSNGKWMNIFEYPGGKLIEGFNHYGGGPEEYQYSYYAFYTPDDQLWSICDLNIGRYNIMQYHENGDFYKKTVIDSIQNISPMSNGNWLAFNDLFTIKNGYHTIREKKLYEYSKDWELLNEITLNDKRWKVPGAFFMDKIYYLNGKNYVTDNDTVYRYDSDTKSLIPAIAIELGKYHYDWGSISSIEEATAAEAIYPIPKLPVFNDKYSWDYYYFRNDPTVVKFDMYDLETGDLVYRRTIPVTDENKMRLITEGFPVEIDGQTVYGNILPFVKDNHFFVCVPMDELIKIYDTDEVNPIIVEIEIES